MAIVGVSMSFGLAKVPILDPRHSSSFTLNSSGLLGPKRIRQERLVGSASSSRTATMSVHVRFGSSKGGAGLLERPSFERSQFEPMTQAKKGGDIGSLNIRKGVRKADRYRVLLIDDIHQTEKLVAMVLPEAVPSVTPVEACKLFHESREKGAAVVIVTVKEHAEFYREMMVRWGLQSTIEPDSSSA